MDDLSRSRWGRILAWGTPDYSRNQVDKAGKQLIAIDGDPHEYVRALDIINNWRAAHGYPLNTFQVTLRAKAKKTGANAFFVSQRIKRLQSIERKLRAGTMQMSQMQDIAGCRAVMATVGQVQRVQAQYDKYGSHERKGEKDYILNPKPDGYRGVHLIYKYKGTEYASDYDGLQVEIQIRTADQHAWATSVEAVGTFTKQALKWRGGTDDWQRFFALMGSVIARREDCPIVPDTPRTKTETRSELRKLVKKLRIREVLRAYEMTLDYVGNLKQSEAKLLLVHMRPEESKVEVQGFKLYEAREATQAYSKIEQSIPSGSASQAVLVRVESLHALQKAYPNYFLDTGRFMSILDGAI